MDEPETEHLRVSGMPITEYLAENYPIIQEYIKNIIGKLFGREIRKIMQKDLNDDDSMFFEK